jgi:hypothetical protein
LLEPAPALPNLDDEQFTRRADPRVGTIEVIPAETLPEAYVERIREAGNTKTGTGSV